MHRMTPSRGPADCSRPQEGMLDDSSRSTRVEAEGDSKTTGFIGRARRRRPLFRTRNVLVPISEGERVLVAAAAETHRASVRSHRRPRFVVVPPPNWPYSSAPTPTVCRWC
jgi:hypothetical protein